MSDQSLIDAAGVLQSALTNLTAAETSRDAIVTSVNVLNAQLQTANQNVRRALSALVDARVQVLANLPGP